MAKIEKFQDLEAWKIARKVTKKIYDISKQEKFCRDFALCNQIRRASISILSNVAEGFERNGEKSFCNFFLSQKRLVRKFMHNFMLRSTKNMLMKCNLRKLPVT